MYLFGICIYTYFCASLYRYHVYPEKHDVVYVRNQTFEMGQLVTLQEMALLGPVLNTFRRRSECPMVKIWYIGFGHPNIIAGSM